MARMSVLCVLGASWARQESAWEQKQAVATRQLERMKRREKEKSEALHNSEEVHAEEEREWEEKHDQVEAQLRGDGRLRFLRHIGKHRRFQTANWKQALQVLIGESHAGVCARLRESNVEMQRCPLSWLASTPRVLRGWRIARHRVEAEHCGDFISKRVCAARDELRRSGRRVCLHAGRIRSSWRK